MQHTVKEGVEDDDEEVEQAGGKDQGADSKPAPPILQRQVALTQHCVANCHPCHHHRRVTPLLGKEVLTGHRDE